MRFLIVETDYSQFLDDLYARHPGLAGGSYDEQLEVRRDARFGYGHSYAEHLRRLGHEATAISANNEQAERAWAREHGGVWLRSRALLEQERRGPARLARRVAWRMSSRRSWLEQVLAAQIHDFAPDVLICLNVVAISQELLGETRRSARLLVGQHAATNLPDVDRLRAYDLLLSPYEPTLRSLRSAGLNAEPIRLAFDPDVLDVVGSEQATHDIAFVGSLFRGVHDSRIALLERLCERFDTMGVWAASVDGLDPSSAIRSRYAGSAWGVDMFRVLRRSRVTVNHHGDFGRYASNCRLFEATGCGSLLVTDSIANLPELFEVGNEVLAYEDADQCIALIEQHLRDESARAAIAAAGQRRTLADHTYAARMSELLERISSYAA